MTIIFTPSPLAIFHRKIPKHPNIVYRLAIYCPIPFISPFVQQQAPPRISSRQAPSRPFRAVNSFRLVSRSDDLPVAPRAPKTTKRNCVATITSRSFAALRVCGPSFWAHEGMRPTRRTRLRGTRSATGGY